MYHSLVGHNREDTQQRVNDPTPEALEENKQAKSAMSKLTKAFPLVISQMS